MEKTYNPQNVEDKWYEYWLAQDFFRSVPDEREPYTIVIPPPNVTGKLHMGHMLNNTIQDLLTRRARMQGYNACWVPGTDHASIATEAKVVKMLQKKGISKSDLTREEFLEYAWAWKEEYGGIILKQLRKLGVSCDWKRTRFTMDDNTYKAVIKVFVDLYRKGKIYRGKRINHWDPVAKTSLSDQEVIHKDEQSKLYHVQYKLEGEDGYVTIATTRPETILGDSAVCFNPNDERFQHLKGKKALVPLINRPIPIIYDDYVEMEFGTGGLKVTPAHDANDFDIGKRHGLEVIDILNDDATMSEAAQLYIGEDRFVARKKIVKDLEEAGHLVKIEMINNKLGYSERTNAVVEPKLTAQWYMSMPETAAPALEAVMNDTVRFFPKQYKNVYKHWMENIRDWCISRQLWWGQRIPVYYLADGSYYVAETAEEALTMAIEEKGDSSLTLADLRQDPDVVDTWFSSWLWPISVFDGFENRDELDYYYPTTVLVTGWDILFLWVARMVMAGYEWEGQRPFQDVYFTGMIRDPKGRKMSKSLGNSPDPIDLMAEYGADGMRLGLLMSSPAGADLLFDAKLCETGSKFANKIWNALRLIKGWEVYEGKNEENLPPIAWLDNKLSQTIIEIESLLETYRISEALKTLYSFIWNDFFSTYLEMVKPDYQQPIDSATYEHTVNFFEKMMQLLHPYMPFITEEVYQLLKEREERDSIMVSSYPTPKEIDQSILEKGEMAKEVISKIRDIRNKNGLKQRAPLTFHAKSSNPIKFDDFQPIIVRKAFLESFNYTDNEVDGAVSFLVGKNTFYVETGVTIDIEAERERIQKEIDRFTKFKTGISKKLSNERFVNNAPEKVVAMERKKMADAEAKIALLVGELGKLN